MGTISKQDIDNFSQDAVDLSAVINGDASTIVTNRDGEPIDSVAKVLATGESDILNMNQYATKALLDADLEPGDNRVGIVTADATAENNAVYVKNGASGSGTWDKVGISGEDGSAASLSLSDYLKIRDVSILDTIDIIDRVEVIPTLDLKAIPDELVPDGASFTRASAATRVNRRGLIESMATNEIRHQFDPSTGKYKGWLLEAASTNFALYCQAINDASWTKQYISTFADSGVAPDGATTAEKLTETTAATKQRRIFKNITLTSGTDFTISIFIKPDGRNGFTMYPNTAGQGYAVDFNLTTNTIANTITYGGATNVDAGIEVYPNGWRRCWIACTWSSAITTLQMGMYFSNNDDNGNSSYTGDGVSGIYMWGAQVEAGLRPTAYIATTSATVTRAEDLFNLDVSAYNWINTSDEATIFLDGAAYPTAGTDFMFGLSIDTSNYIGMYLSSGIITGRIQNSGSSSYSINGAITDGADIKAALSYKSGEQNFYVNGTANTSGTSIAIPTGFDKIDVGNIRGGSNINGTIKRLCYFARTLSTLQLQQITG